MRTRILPTISLLLVASSLLAQNQWHIGEINTKYGIFECKDNSSIYISSFFVVNKLCTDKRVNLPWGIDERQGLSVSINSERHLYNAVTTAIPREKFLAMVETKERYFAINFDLSETGEIMRIQFLINKQTIITPDEVATMDSLIRENLRFKVVREYDYGEPHKLIQSFYVSATDVLNGEIGPAKRNEMSGKQYW